MVTVPLFQARIDQTAIAAAEEAMRSGWIGMGPRVAAFEAAFARYLGLDADGSRQCVATNSCTSALDLALRLHNFERGSEVITTPMTFIATNQTLLWQGLKPVFADVDPYTGLLSPESVELCLTDKTCALMVVHLGGRAAAMDKFAAIAGRHKLVIIEDCAHAAGAYYGDPGTSGRVGSSGNLCGFSFSPTKPLTTGDGGLLAGLAAAQLDIARKLRVLGMSKDIFRRVGDSAAPERFWDYDVEFAGARIHMNDITASLGLAHLPQLDAANARRTELAARYDEQLANVPGIRIVPSNPGDSHYLHWVLAENRDALARALYDRGITTGVYYRPNSQYAPFAQCTGPQGRREWPNAVAFFQRQLCLPVFPSMTAQQQDHVIASIRQGW